ESDTHWALPVMCWRARHHCRAGPVRSPLKTALDFLDPHLAMCNDQMQQHSANFPVTAAESRRSDSSRLLLPTMRFAAGSRISSDRQSEPPPHEAVISRFPAEFQEYR